jgi:hypothetical protein
VFRPSTKKHGRDDASSSTAADTKKKKLAEAKSKLSFNPDDE